VGNDQILTDDNSEYRPKLTVTLALLQWQKNTADIIQTNLYLFSYKLCILVHSCCQHAVGLNE